MSVLVVLTESLSFIESSSRREVAVETAPVLVEVAASVPVDLYETTADPTVDKTAAMTAMNNVPVAIDRRMDCFPQPL
jgi:hypothetical protein